MASPEPEQPCEKRENEPDRCADEELVRQDAGKSRSDENGARDDSHKDAQEGAKHPIREEGAEQDEGRCAARASTQGQRQDRREQHTCVLLGRTHRTDLSHSRRKPITGDDAVNGLLKSTRIMPPPPKLRCARRFGQSGASTRSDCANLEQGSRASLSISAPLFRIWP